MLEIVPLPAFKDNYIWTLRDGGNAAVVDPGEAGPVREYLAREKLSLVAILATHHHPDHVGGIAELVAAKKLPVFGPKGEPIPSLTHPVGQDDRVDIPEIGARFSVLDIPGHTRAHVAYYGLGSLFCGDTLFACGCGRVFEGTPAQMLASLQKLAAREARAARLREAGKPTLPSTLGEERATNPFLRCAEPAVIDSANKYLGARAADPARVFAAIREWKNKF